MPSSKSVKQGGNLQKNVASLMVPFGLILAKNSLEKFLKAESKKSSAASPKKKVSLAGGANAVAANASPVSGGKPKSKKAPMASKAAKGGAKKSSK